MGLYKVTGPTPVFDAEPGDTLDHDFTASEEADLLDRGRLTLEPRDYRVIGDHNIDLDGQAHGPGDKFKGAFTVGQEAALIEGEHIERFVAKPKAQPKAADTKNKE